MSDDSQLLLFTAKLSNNRPLFVDEDEQQDHDHEVMHGFPAEMRRVLRGFHRQEREKLAKMSEGMLETQDNFKDLGVPLTSSSRSLSNAADFQALAMLRQKNIFVIRTQRYDTTLPAIDSAAVNHGAYTKVEDANLKLLESYKRDFAWRMHLLSTHPATWLRTQDPMMLKAECDVAWWVNEYGALSLKSVISSDEPFKWVASEVEMVKLTW